MLFPCHRHIHHGQNHASGRTTSREQNRVGGRCLTVWATSTQHRWCFGRWNIVGPSVRPRKAMGVDQFRRRSEAPQANNSASRKSTRAFGSQASCTMISDISTWSRKPCNPSTTRSARGCHPCLRYVPLPMCPGWTGKSWSGRRDSNPRPQPWQGCALPLSYTRIREG